MGDLATAMSTAHASTAVEIGTDLPAPDLVRARGTWATSFAYVDLVKPRLVSLLVFTSVAGMLLAAATAGVALGLGTFLVGLVAITTGTAGCNAVTGYLDRDVDRIMERTRHRPLPMGLIEPPIRALVFGLGLVAASLVLSALGNLVALTLMAVGIVDNVVVYSLWLKRTSSWNIVLGGISGGMPVAFGWAFVTGSVGLAAVLLAALVVLWTPTHIWSLALRYRDDYARAHIPMLPVVAKETTALRCMVSTAALLVPFSLALPLATPVAGLGYTVVAAAFGIPLLGLSLWLGLRPTRERAWVLFKFSSPYLAVVFLALILSAMW